MAESDSVVAGPCDKLPDSGDLDIARVRERLAKLVLDNASDILQAAIEKAKHGHYSATKLLFALAGIYPAPPAADQSLDRSLAEYFCKQLGLPELEAENTGGHTAPDAEPAHSLE